MKLFVFGLGYVGEALCRRRLAEGDRCGGTSRDPERRERLTADGIETIDPADAAALRSALEAADALLISAPPDDHGCPGYAALAPLLRAGAASPRWIGYLSSTSVYGDLEGRWAFEVSPLRGRSCQAVRRTAAEADWLRLGEEIGAPVAVFRLGAIYGPRRSALERAIDGPIRIMIKPGQVFSRIHVDDICALLEASLAKPSPGRIYNAADDEPSSAESVATCASALIGAPPPHLIPFDERGLSDAARRFWQEARRVSNARAKAELGWRPDYPSYREGLAALAASFNRGSGPTAL